MSAYYLNIDISPECTILVASVPNGFNAAYGIVVTTSINGTSDGLERLPFSGFRVIENGTKLIYGRLSSEGYPTSHRVTLLLNVGADPITFQAGPQGSEATFTVTAGLEFQETKDALKRPNERATDLDGVPSRSAKSEKGRVESARYLLVGTSYLSATVQADAPSGFDPAYGIRVYSDGIYVRMGFSGFFVSDDEKTLSFEKTSRDGGRLTFSLLLRAPNDSVTVSGTPPESYAFRISDKPFP